MALYSPSTEDLAIVECFLDFQLIGDMSRSTIYPITDLLLIGHEAQSEYFVSLKESAPLNKLNSLSQGVKNIIEQMIQG